MHRTFLFAVAFQGLAAPLGAQDEAALRSYFEGRAVSVQLGVPARETGVEGVLFRYTITSR